MVLSWGTWDLQHSLWHARSLVAACKMLLAACRIQFPVQFSSVAQSCLILCNPMNCSMPGLPVHHQLPSTPKPMSIELVIPSNHLTLCHPLLLLPSIFPSIRVFSNESALRIRWPKNWSFNCNISPSNEHPGLPKPISKQNPSQIAGFFLS